MCLFVSTRICVLPSKRKINTELELHREKKKKKKKKPHSNLEFMLICLCVYSLKYVEDTKIKKIYIYIYMPRKSRIFLIRKSQSQILYHYIN